MQNLQLSDVLITALSRLVDDGLAEVKREPMHSTLTFHFQQSRLMEGDPAHAGQTVGKARRVRAVLSWAMEHAPQAGGRLAVTLVNVPKGLWRFPRGIAELRRSGCYHGRYRSLPFGRVSPNAGR